MRRYRPLLTLTALAFAGGLSAQTAPQQANDRPEPDEQVYDLASVQETPEFPGGTQALYAYVGRNTRYPKDEADRGIQGKVYVEFTVARSGKVKDVRIMRGIPEGPGLAEEAERVIGAMPDWKPGTMNGKPVPVRYVLPVDFKLSGPGK